MAKRVIDVTAEDNKYLHRDFHCGMNEGIFYLGTNYGDNAVDEYLRRFADVFYAPLIADIQARGLAAMQEKIEHDYAEEEVPGDCRTELKDGELTVTIDKCPAVTHIKKCGYTPCKWFGATTSAVYGEIATKTGFGFDMLYYFPETGAAKYRFFKRGIK